MNNHVQHVVLYLILALNRLVKNNDLFSINYKNQLQTSVRELFFFFRNLYFSQYYVCLSVFSERLANDKLTESQIPSSGYVQVFRSCTKIKHRVLQFKGIGQNEGTALSSDYSRYQHSAFYVLRVAVGVALKLFLHRWH